MAVGTTPLGVEGVPAAFDEAAPRYDLMVALNPGYHRHLRAAAGALVEGLPADRTGTRVLDLGCGSGASTRALVRATRREPAPALVGVDASLGMLEQARTRRWPTSVSFHHGLAEELNDCRERWGLREQVDGVFAAYLFRNVQRRNDVLSAVRSALRPGGVIVVQEYSVSGSLRARLLWSLVCWLVVIPLSWLTSRQTRLYRYLWRSVLAFDSVDRFVGRLHAAGFVDVEVSTVGGWQRGILHTFRARTPSTPPTP
jgi:ubiquinone/menaquinone biosynthesis C-methylase UbiE